MFAPGGQLTVISLIVFAGVLSVFIILLWVSGKEDGSALRALTRCCASDKCTHWTRQKFWKLILSRVAENQSRNQFLTFGRGMMWCKPHMHAQCNFLRKVYKNIDQSAIIWKFLHFFENFAFSWGSKALKVRELGLGNTWQHFSRSKKNFQIFQFSHLEKFRKDAILGRKTEVFHLEFLKKS